MNEDTAILLAKEGNANAFRELYDSYRESVYRLAYRYTRSQQDAEDIMQDTFIKAFKGIGSFNFHHSSSFTAWLHRICVNCSISYLRKNKSRRMDQTLSLSELPAEPHAGGLSPEESARTEETLRLIEKAAGSLSAKQRIIFDLRYAQHRAIKEIAEYMNCSESTIKTNLFRSVAKLRNHLGPLLEER